jgi:tetratricopeptide (TPR) repeat protein
MNATKQRQRTVWCVPILAIGVLLAASCTSTPAASQPSIAQWSGLQDCFDRDVAVPDTSASSMATLCGGASAAEDPAHSGIARANAYFNAAAAYNAVAKSGQEIGLCESSAACHQVALNFLDNSIVNQTDDQVLTGAANSGAGLNSRFVLRRQLERAIALRGLASDALGVERCGGRTACLAEAAKTLEAFDAGTAFKANQPSANALGCRVLDERWRVNFARGRQFEYQYVEDLIQVDKACPSLSCAAGDQLAEIAFHRAERIRAGLSIEGASPSLDTALGAITDYKEAAKVARFELASNRGMGAVYQMLSRLQPSGARSYLENAVESYQRTLELGIQSELDDARAEDFDRLGTSLAALAGRSSHPGSEERIALYVRAADAFRGAIALSPSPSRYLRLAEANAAIGEYAASAAAYRSAIAGLSGGEKTQASLALVVILDRMGHDADALGLLNQVSAEAPDTPEVEYEIGLREFNDGQMEAALAKLAPVVERLPAEDAAESHYMISAAEVALRKPGWRKRALTHADLAVALNAGRWAYSRQDCLAHVLAGGAAVKTGSSLMRCPEAEGAEAKLLRGMYLLKQAQSLDVSAYDLASQTRWRGVLRSAEAEFQHGLALLQGESSRNRKVWFDDLQAEVDVASRLGQAISIVQRCTRETDLGPDDPAWQDMESFFGFYGVLKCS